MMIIQNPILKREFQGAARSLKTMLLGALSIFALSFIIYVLWPRSGVFSDANSNELFTIFLGAELTFMLLLTAGFTASSITVERERGTFAMLQTSLLTPGEIMVGKLCGSLGISYMLFIMTIPVASISALSGGISGTTLLKALAIVAVSTLVYGLLGLAISSICRKTYVSILVTYICVALLAGATWLPYALFKSDLLRPYLLRLRAVSPYEALFALQFGERYEAELNGASASSVFLIFIISMAVLALIFFCIFAKFIFAPPHLSSKSTVERYDDKKTMLKRKLGWPFYLIDPLKRKKPIGNFRNPVFVAELRSKIFGNPRFIARALSACICISLGLLVAILRQVGDTELDKIRAVAIIFQLGLVALLAPTVSSGSITDERMSDTLLQLRLSPLTPLKVVLGKMKAALVYVLIFLLSSVPVLLVLALLDSNGVPDLSGTMPASFSFSAISASIDKLTEAFSGYWRVFAWVAVLIMSCLMFTSAGLFASCLSPTTGIASSVSYGFALALSILSLGVLMFGSRVSGEVQAAFLIFNPFMAALDITLDKSFAAQLPQLFGNRLWVNHLYISCILTVVMLIGSAIKVHFIFREQK